MGIFRWARKQALEEKEGEKGAPLLSASKEWKSFKTWPLLDQYKFN